MCKLLIAEETMNEGIRSLAGQIAGHFGTDGKPFALVGIQQLGVPLARLLSEQLTLLGYNPDYGQLDITMYRDDFGKRSVLPKIRETIIPFDVNGREIILVDDVLSSGRTIRAALDALTDYGRPGLIRLAVLVDRENPEFPIRADFVGFKVQEPPDRKIVVRFDGGGDLPAGIYSKEWK